MVRGLCKHAFLALTLPLNLLRFEFHRFLLLQLSMRTQVLYQLWEVRWFLLFWSVVFWVDSCPWKPSQSNIFHWVFRKREYHYCKEIYLCSDCTSELLQREGFIFIQEVLQVPPWSQVFLTPLLLVLTFFLTLLLVAIQPFKLFPPFWLSFIRL